MRSASRIVVAVVLLAASLSAQESQFRITATFATTASALEEQLGLKLEPRTEPQLMHRT